MKAFSKFAPFMFVVHQHAFARNWKDFVDLTPIEDPAKQLLCQEFDALKITERPSTEPSSFPTITDPPTTSSIPSDLPSEFFSSLPSAFPSATGSSSPTSLPSIVPSALPTAFPTFFPTAPRPLSSFSYNPYARHGPPSWGNVNVDDNEFKEFEELRVHKNRCAWTTQAQSPIDLSHNAKCVEHHQIRTRRGDFNLTEAEFTIRPNALRMEFPRRTEVSSVNGTKTVRLPPQADASDGWARFPAKHMEIKIPSEHTIYGKRYPAEITIVHAAKKRILTVAILVEVGDKKNKKFDVFLDEWENVFLERVHECERRKRRRTEEHHHHHHHRPRYERKRKTPAELERVFGPRRLNDGKGGSSDFAFYSFLPTIWFFGYSGSLTVPPCTTNHWRVLERPLVVDEKQMGSIRNMILNQLDEDCNPSTAAYDGGVNRPLQTNSAHPNVVPVWHCTDRDYGPDRPEKWPHLEPYYFEERDY